jgi:hypothetical protein
MGGVENCGGWVNDRMDIARKAEHIADGYLYASE